MKKLISSFIALGFITALLAQSAPPGMRYQAVTRDADGQLIVNEPMTAKIEMLSVENGDRVYYEETHDVSSNQYGLLNFTIGEGYVSKGSYDEIPWSEQNIWVRISIKRQSESTFNIVSTNKLYSVPYAHYASKAGELTEAEPPQMPGEGPQPSGGSVWSLHGNMNADIHNDPPVLGTTDSLPVVFITNGQERMRVQEDGTIKIVGDLNVGEDAIVGMDLTVKQDAFLNTDGGSTEIDGPTTIGGPGMNTATFTGDVRIDKDLSVGGAAELDSTFTVAEETTLDSSLIVNGSTRLNDHTVIGGDGMKTATFTGNVQMNKKLAVDGSTRLNDSLTVHGPTTFDIEVTGDQTVQTSYPVLIKGSDQGLAIELTPAVDPAYENLKSHRGNNYISFWRDGQQKGRIEGMGRADLDPTGLVSLFVGMIQSPPSALSGIGVTYDPFSVGNPDNIEDLLNFSKGIFPSLTGGIDFDKGTLPSFTTFLLSGFNAGTLPNLSENFDLTSGTLPNLGFGSISSLIDFSDPFGSSAYSPFSSIIGSFNGEDPVSPANAVWTTIKSSLMASGMYPADPTNFESQIFSNYTLDIVQQGIGTLSSAVTFLTSLGSILDPEDIFSEGVDVVANVVSLIIYGAYADINLGVAYESGAGDYAEWLLRADPNELIRPGDVVGVIGGKISRKFTHADRFMVVSTSPLLLGNMPDNRADERFYEKIAFIGQVPVKVMGKVNVGDYILPSGSGDGVAIAVSPEDMLARDYQHIIGVAWESNTTDDFIKLVNTAVGVNHNDMSKVIEQMQYTLNNVQASLQKLDPSFEAHMYNVSDYAGAVARPDYHVSSTHVSRVSGYFDNKTYTNRAEMLTDVKNAMTDKAGIDLSKVPFMEYIFENPYQAERLASEYQQVLDDMIMVRDQLVLQQGD